LKNSKTPRPGRHKVCANALVYGLSPSIPSCATLPVCPAERGGWTARMAIAALDGDRGHPAEPVFRRVGPVARHIRTKNDSRLAFVACISPGRNPRRSCGDHACADRHSLSHSRLCPHSHPLLVAQLLSSIIQPQQIKRGTARATLSRRVAKGFITHRRAETAEACCQLGWLGNGQTSSIARGPRSLCCRCLSADLSSLVEIGGRTDSCMRTELHSNRPNGSGTNKTVESRSATPCNKMSKLHVQTCNRCDCFASSQPLTDPAASDVTKT
jgi:hypothetical protein